MQRKPGFPVANCSIKMPDNVPSSEALEEEEPQQRRQQLINFGHAQWGFNNWSWAVSKQDLDFVDLTCGKYTAGVAAFVSITIKTLDIHRENVGYATALAPNKGSAIHRARKCAVTNALRETLLSFGGAVASELMELDAHRVEVAPDLLQDSPVLASKATPSPVSEPKNAPVKNTRKEESNGPGIARVPVAPPAVKNAASVAAPVAKALPMPANLPPAANRPPPRAPPASSAAAPPPAPPPLAVQPPLSAQPPHTAQPPHAVPHAPPHGPHGVHARPNSNVSFVVPVMGGVVPPVYAPPRLGPPPAPHLFPNAYYEYAGPWHFAYEPYERAHGNVNLNFNIPPKNLVVNGRAGSVECKNACGRDGDAAQFGAQPNRGCWIKPTIFYDGFWTEQKVKKWVAEQVEKQFPDERKPPEPEPPAPKP
ncbi:uncharacterized protein [Epargyreus clarus]|uniref:uncharacterized protein n=1 Tax=Epargyreus clarus TaxID=520877 RepID=UPI003C2EDA05